MPECRGLGHSVLRKEDPRFLQGQGRYIDDITLPGMLYLDIARSPYAHARITRIVLKFAHHAVVTAFDDFFAHANVGEFFFP